MNDNCVYVNDNYRFYVDSQNYKLEKRYENQKSRGRNGDKNGNFSWKTVGYYSKLEYLTKELIEMEVKSKILYDLNEIIEHMELTQEQIMVAISTM